MIAALYVEPRGVYAVLPNVDLWDEVRDARFYAGPWPVVAHPPCARWGRYASGGPSHHGRFAPGDDGGCFAAALAAVRRWGGVLEHPRDSKAFAAHGLATPPRDGGWVPVDAHGHACCVSQGHYGHRADKPTWLYAVRCALPDLMWGSAQQVLPQQSTTSLSRRGRGSYTPNNAVERMSKRERLATPIPFRDLLIDIAASSFRY